MGWGPCQSGGALPEVPEVTTSLGPVVSPEGFPASCLGSGEQRGISLAASDLGSWGEAALEAGARRSRADGVVAGGRGQVWPLLLQTCCLSCFLSGVALQAFWDLGAAGLSEPSSHAVDFRFSSFAELDTTCPLAFLTVQS